MARAGTCNTGKVTLSFPAGTDPRWLITVLDGFRADQANRNGPLIKLAQVREFDDPGY